MSRRTGRSSEFPHASRPRHRPRRPADQDDRAFLTKDVQGARSELALAKLAQAKATHPQVRSYARIIAREHETANAQLTRLARSQGVKPSSRMTPQDGQTLDKLKP